MKILYCTPGLYNKRGTEMVLTHKASYLVERYGFDVTIITTEQKGRPISFPLCSKVKVVDFGLNFEDELLCNPVKKLLSHIRKNRTYRRMLTQYLKENPQDVCVSFCGKEIEFLPGITDGSAKIAELHFSKHYAALFTLEHHKGILWQAIAHLKTRFLVHNTQKFDKLVVLTQADASDWSTTNANVTQIYNAMPTIPMAPSECTAKRFIAAGGLAVEKGFDMAIRVWEKVHESHPDWHLDIYGEGPLRESLQRQIDARGLTHIVTLKGQTDNLYAEMVASSGYLLTSLREGFPRVLLEASLCGLPIVAHDCQCGPREIVEEGSNGYLVPYKDEQACANAILRLIEHDDQRQHMGMEARRQVLSRFHEDIIMPQWQQLFTQVARL